METISSIQETDTSAIDRLEADRATQRQDIVDAANIATKRSALLKSGLGIGAAAMGIGVGGLLLFFGISLIVGRPTHEETSQVFRKQITAIEGLANEKIEAIRAQSVSAIASAKREADETAAQTDRAMAQAKAVTETFTSSSGKTVVDFNIFRKQEIDGLRVVTGWKYQKTGDPVPSFQWCYVHKMSDPNGLNLSIAIDGQAKHFNPETTAKAGLTWAEVQKALPYCDWFKGISPNIRDSSAQRL